MRVDNRVECNIIFLKFICSGTRDSDPGEICKEQESSRFCLTFVHPVTAHGCKPVNLVKFYNFKEHILTGTTVTLLVHCPSLHDIVLDAYDRQASECVRQLLGYVKFCVGQRNRGQFQFKDADQCESRLEQELSERFAITRRLPIGRGYCAVAIGRDLFLRVDSRST